MDVDTCYAELGLTPNCTDAEIKAAWRRLAARWHPDRNDSPQALRKIQRINRALEEIRKARRMGLAVGADDEEDAAPDPPSPAKPPQARRPRKTLDHTVHVTLEEAIAGCARDLQGEVVDDCPECNATGRQARPSECADCGGTGQVRQQLWFGWVSQSVTCATCQGQGSTRHACAACAGCGKAAARTYRCRVRIPAGTRGGDVLHAPAQAHSPDADDGETVRVRVELQPHEFFQLDDDGTVKCELPVDGFAWIANRWTEVPTPGGLQQMRLKRNHLVYRIKGQGFPTERSGPRADCIITVVPLFPDEFNAKQDAQIDRLVAMNSGAGDTAAGLQVSQWNRVLKEWEARLH